MTWGKIDNFQNHVLNLLILIINSYFAISESDYVTDSRESNAKLIRMKRQASPMDFNMSTNTVAKDLDDPVRNHDVVNAIYTIVIFFVIFLFEIGGNK